MSLTEQTTRFIDTKIDSVDQLEILRLLAAHRNRIWGADVLAQQLQIQPESLMPHLKVLESRGLITVSRLAGITYRHGPVNSELDDQLMQMLQQYNERPVTVIRRVYNKPSQ